MPVWGWEGIFSSKLRHFEDPLQLFQHALMATQVIFLNTSDQYTENCIIQKMTLWKLFRVNEYTKSLISPVHLQKIDQITPALLRDASKRLKPGKSDQMYAFSSDCFRNGPDILYDLLSWTIRCCILHNHINDVLLISTLVPLVKDRFRQHKFKQKL